VACDSVDVTSAFLWIVLRMLCTDLKSCGSRLKSARNDKSKVGIGTTKLKSNVMRFQFSHAPREILAR
jgi:hypothetical protein